MTRKESVATRPSQSALARPANVAKPNPSQRLAEHRDRIRSLVTEHHARDPRLFGSAARGDDQPGSDLDFLVDFTDEATLLDEIGLRLALTDLLEIEVDVVAADTLRGVFRDRVLREAVPV